MHRIILTISAMAAMAAAPLAAQGHDQHAGQTGQAAQHGQAAGAGHAGMAADHCAAMMGGEAGKALQHAEHLGLTAEQVEALEAVRAEMKAAMARANERAGSILTPEQREQLESMGGMMGHGGMGHAQTGSAHHDGAGTMMECPMMKGAGAGGQAGGAHH